MAEMAMEMEMEREAPWLVAGGGGECISARCPSIDQALTLPYLSFNALSRRALINISTPLCQPLGGKGNGAHSTLCVCVCVCVLEVHDEGTQACPLVISYTHTSPHLSD